MKGKLSGKVFPKVIYHGILWYGMGIHWYGFWNGSSVTPVPRYKGYTYYKQLYNFYTMHIYGLVIYINTIAENLADNPQQST